MLVLKEWNKLVLVNLAPYGKMLHILLLVTEEERNMMEGYVKVQGVSLSEAINHTVFDALIS